ncbi:hypothetical protein P7H21_04350 [Paenibacillus larvae]|nr:hypothetical protein [Paenibacillus larvae]MDT2303420.1 hypothetical protein [Paenibacillus larvae]
MTRERCTWLSSNPHTIEPETQKELQQKTLLSNHARSELKAVIRRKRPNYVKSSAIHVAENGMNRGFYADSPNLKWCTDVTELKYGNGRKAYLSAIVDVWADNSIVSWVLSPSNNKNSSWIR